MNAMFVTVAALTTLTANPAVADPAATAATTVNADQLAAVQTASSGSQRVCVVDTVTGSRLPVKVCKTRAEWAKDGVDIDQQN